LVASRRHPFIFHEIFHVFSSHDIYTRFITLSIRLFVNKVTVEVLGANVTFTLASKFAFINHPFTVNAHSTTGIVIDFNLNQDLNLNSKIFTPNVGFVAN